MVGTWTQEVRGVHARMDAEIGGWQTSHSARGGRIHCGRGCSNCCRLAVESTFPEAFSAAEKIAEIQSSLLEGWVEKLKENLWGAVELKDYLRGYLRTMGGCPFVREDGACAIYSVRPLACRALLSTRNGAWCGIDPGTLHPLEKKAFLSGLDRDVVAWPTHYAAAPQETGGALEAEISLSMARRHGFSLSGNFPYLLWLILRRDLAGAVSKGKEAARELLLKEGAPSLVARIGA